MLLAAWRQPLPRYTYLLCMRMEFIVASCSGHSLAAVLLSFLLIRLHILVRPLHVTNITLLIVLVISRHKPKEV